MSDVLQYWSGHVCYISTDKAYFRLCDVTAGEEWESVELEVPIEQVPEHVRTEMRVGSYIDVKVRAYGIDISLTKVPKWTKEQLERAREEGKRRAAALIFE